MYDTKDSGVRSEYSTGMVRDTQEGKARFDLLFPKGVPFDKQMLTRFAELMERGAKKYNERNWEKAETQEELDRYHSSAIRHLVQWINGEDDEDHAAAVMFNLLAYETTKYKMGQKLPIILPSRALDRKLAECDAIDRAGHKCVNPPLHLNLHECELNVRWTETATGGLHG